MNRVASNIFTEKVLFYSILTFNILMLFSVKFYPSMDGPSHLYNSNLIIHLITGDSQEINQFFSLNHSILPNWISYFILSTFNSFLPAWMAEKMFFVIYLVSISISFRLLISQLSPGNTSMSVLIFPFAWSFLFMMGFYNYSFSFVFLFFTLYYWLKTAYSKKKIKYFYLFILLTLSYFSALLTFAFTGILLGLFAISFSFKTYLSDQKGISFFRIAAKEILMLLVISLPALVFSYLFIRNSNFFSTNDRLAVSELFKWIYDVRCLIVYDYNGEKIFTKPLFFILLFIFAIAIYSRFYNKDSIFNLRKIRKIDILIIPILLALVLLFLVPNGANAGMMSDRFCLLFYMLLIIWISTQYLPKKLNFPIVLLICILQISLVFKHQNNAIKTLDKHAVAINKAADFMDKNSIVLPINLSDNWLEPHFSNYLGIDKPLVILENYEASVGWFPVNWNKNKLPNLKLGQFESLKNLKWINNSESKQTIQIDYVCLYGNISKLNNPEWAELKAVLKMNFELIYHSGNSYVSVYKYSNSSSYSD